MKYETRVNKENIIIGQLHVKNVSLLWSWVLIISVFSNNVYNLFCLFKYSFSCLLALMTVRSESIMLKKHSTPNLHLECD